VSDSAPASPQAGTPATDAVSSIPRSRRDTTAPTHEEVERRRLLHVTAPGVWGAVVFSCLSFTPSLLPRTGVIQGLVWGITAAVGYGVGVLLAAIWRAFADRGPRAATSRTWRITLVAGAVLLVVSFGLGQYWQSLIRDLMGVTEYNVVLVALSPVIAFAVFALLVALGRGIRALYRWLDHLLRRWMGPRAAAAVGWLVVAGLVYLVVTGVLLDGLVSAANTAFSTRDTTTAEGVKQPTTDLRSGGPGSLVPWDTLGWQGRTFTGSGPTAAEITALMHTPAQEPIRAYAGLATAGDAETRARLAVDDLERAGGFRRANLLVVTTTGSGWVNDSSANTFEYLTAGNSAIVAMQYSYLPSWLSYLVDQSEAREAGRTLFDTVYEKWSALPSTARPRLFVSGESLGSFGGETAFSGEFDLRNRTSGAVFAGPPNFNTLFTEFRDHRDAGSLERLPVYKGGRTVRFTDDATTGIPPAGVSWEGPRAVYLMHASDPIVWWSPRLILGEPDWADEPPGKDVLGRVVWLPLVTFWQVTADLTFAGGVPDGHGHAYKAEYADAWNAVLRPAGVTPEELAQVRAKAAAVP
jgi:uncharacterized membrane protein